jgi:hypothetical protein
MSSRPVNLAHGEQVYTRTDMLKIALRDQYVPEDWYLRGP